MKWKNKGHEYDVMSEKFSNKDTKYYIWGAGTFGIAFYEDFCDKLNIIGFVDNNEKKQGSKVSNLEVLSPEQFCGRYRAENEIVLVSTGLTRAVYNQLESYGLIRHVNYYHIDECASVYMIYKHDKVYVNDLTVTITQFCSLKCEYCNAFIPKIERPVHYDFEFIKEEIKKYFVWVDQVNILGLCGGDAMCHPEFADILEWIGETWYPDRAKNIEIYSNAVILPTERILSLFKKYNVFYRFTDYSGASGKQNIEKMIHVLEENNIRYDHVKFDNWYDSGYPQQSNGITTEEGLIRFFDMCDRKSCHDIMGEKIFNCGMCLSAEQISYCTFDKTDYFDLSHYEANRRKEFIEYYLGYSEKGYYNYCKMCNGGMNVNTHKIVAGTQIERKKEEGK